MFFCFQSHFMCYCADFYQFLSLKGTQSALPTPSLEIARATPFYSVTGIFGATPSSFAFGIFSFR